MNTLNSLIRIVNNICLILGTDSEAQSSDNVTHYANFIKKHNGLPEEKTDTIIDIKDTIKISNGTENLDTTTDISKQVQHSYEVNVWYEESELQYLAVEKIVTDRKTLESIQSSDDAATIPTTTLSDISEKTSTNGSVSSFGPFSLPSVAERMATTSSLLSSNSSADSQKCFDGKFAVPALPAAKRTKHTVTGTVALCNFMIEHFRKIKQEINKDIEDDDSGSEIHTPVSGRGKSVKKNLTKGSPDLLSTPHKSGGKRGAPSSKRALEKHHDDDDEEDDEPKAKQSKSNKKEVKKEKVVEPEEDKPSYSVLARWVDKKYYAGRVTDTKAGNKFVVLFEDGASKVLPQDYIVFGDDDVLPLLDQAVHVLVEGDTYEPGLVTEIKKEDNTVLYTVTAESKIVSVTSSGIYLEEDQAKLIQNSLKGIPAPEVLKTPETPSSKRAGRPPAKLEESQNSRSRSVKKTPQTPATPEPGCSGNASGRKGRRTKRYS